MTNRQALEEDLSKLVWSKQRERERERVPDVYALCYPSLERTVLTE